MPTRSTSKTKRPARDALALAFAAAQKASSSPADRRALRLAAVLLEQAASERALLAVHLERARRAAIRVAGLSRALGFDDGHPVVIVAPALRGNSDRALLATDDEINVAAELWRSFAAALAAKDNSKSPPGPSLDRVSGLARRVKAAAVSHPAPAAADRSKARA